MKKGLLSFLVFLLVFSLAVPAFASTSEFTDLSKAKYSDAIKELAALGVVNGYEDGSFRPEANITRAEFAKIAVIAYGKGNSAKYFSGAAKFKDKNLATHWANKDGWIGAAAAFGLVKGTPDGNFLPDANIKAEEVVTVLLRMLGYNDNLPGSWPVNYVVKANELGVIVDGFEIGKPATRDLVAGLTSAALAQKTVTYDKETNSFKLGTSTLKEVVFGVTKKDAVLLNPNLSSKGEISVVDGTYATDNLVVLGAPSLASLLGHNVSLTFKGGKVTAIENAQKASEIVEGKIDTITVSGAVYSIKLKDSSANYSLKDALVTYNGVAATAADLKAGATVKVFVKSAGSTDARFVVATNYDVVDEYFKSFVAETSFRNARLTTSGNTYELASGYKIFVDGVAAQAKDLTTTHIVSLSKDASGKVVAVYATTPQVVEGKVTAVKTVGSTTYVTVNGSEFTLASGVTPPKPGDDVKLTLGTSGKVIAVVGATTAKTAKVIVLDQTNVNILDGNVVKTVAQVTLFDVEKAEKITYQVPVKSDGTVDTTKYVDFSSKKGEFGKVTFNADGVVAKDGYNVYSVYTATDVGVNATTNTIKAGSQTYLVTDSTVFVARALKDGVWSASAAKFSDLVNGAADIEYVVNANGYSLDYVIVNDAGVATNVVRASGIVKSIYTSTTADGTKYFVEVFGADNNPYETASVVDSVYSGKLVRIMATTGKFSVEATATDLTGKVQDYANGLFKTSTSANYVVNGATKVLVKDVAGNYFVGSTVDLAAIADAVVGTDVEVSVLTAIDKDGNPVTLGGNAVAEIIFIQYKK